jgi:hypothetical protein
MVWASAMGLWCSNLHYLGLNGNLGYIGLDQLYELFWSCKFILPNCVVCQFVQYQMLNFLTSYTVLCASILLTM